MDGSLKIALAQYPDGRDCSTIIEQSEKGGAEIVVFPEMYSNGHAHFDSDDPRSIERWHATAEHADGQFVARFREAARKHRIYVVATLLECGDPKPFNTALLVDPDGQTVLHHRKVHICDFDSPEMACGRGTEFAVANIATSAGLVTTGLMICMDREYPEAARQLSRAGAEIALVPNCCRLVDDAPYGDVRIAQTRGRAFETVMGIAVANYPAPRCDGHSFAAGPTGAVISMADENETLAIVNFDLGFIRRMRQQEYFRWRI
jgi:predicted amidohydrolase